MNRVDRTSRYFMKYYNCKKCGKCEDEMVEWSKNFNYGKKLSDYCKNHDMKYEDCKSYLEYVKVIRSYFFECLKCESKQAI